MLIGLGVVAAVVSAFLPKPVEVDLAKAERGAMLVTVNEDGKTRVKERYDVSTPLAGRLLRIELKAGDAVEAGKTLLAIVEPNEPELLTARAVAQAEARVKAADAAKERAAPALKSALASHQLAETNYARVQRLAGRGAGSPQDVDDTEHKLRVAKEDVRAAQFAAQVAEFELEQAKAALLRARPDSLGNPSDGRFEIKSPISGRVLRVFQESAGAVTVGTKLIELGNPRDLECEIDVLSTDAVKIRPGARAILEHWGGDEPLEGRVRLVEPAAFTKVSALGVEEQRVNVLIDFVDPFEKRTSLGDAFRVEARIVVWEKDNVLKVPAGALFRQAERWAGYVAQGGHARLRFLRIGHNNGEEAEVLDGLKEGNQIVVHPSDKIAEGTAIVARREKE
jgi:HlyD family secretion protein